MEIGLVDQWSCSENRLWCVAFDINNELECRRQNFILWYRPTAVMIFFTHQKLAPFLRVISKNPALLVLDEAFSWMDDQQLMLRYHEIVEKDLTNTTVLAIGHLDLEVPKCNYLLKLIGDEKRFRETYKN